MHDGLSVYRSWSDTEDTSKFLTGLVQKHSIKYYLFEGLCSIGLLY
jgi:hypothetical protein